MNWNMRAAVSVLLLGLLSAGVCFAGPGIGQPAPNFTLPDSANRNRSLSDYTPGHNKVVMLNFWASW